VGANNKVGKDPGSFPSLFSVRAPDPAREEQGVTIRSFHPNHIIGKEEIAVFSRSELRTDLRINDVADHQQPFRCRSFDRSLSGIGKGFVGNEDIEKYVGIERCTHSSSALAANIVHKFVDGCVSLLRKRSGTLTAPFPDADLHRNFFQHDLSIHFMEFDLGTRIDAEFLAEMSRNRHLPALTDFHIFKYESKIIFRQMVCPEERGLVVALAFGGRHVSVDVRRKIGDRLLGPQVRIFGSQVGLPSRRAKRPSDNGRWEDEMRIDWYTKGVLTVIAVLLGVIAIRPYVSPDAVQAQGSFAGVDYGGGLINRSPEFFDTRTGEIWIYFDAKPSRRFRLTKLGEPLVEIR
jgi:hypothetical protein